ncbi:hypothetical protein [Spirosoma litoris]
MTKLTLIKLIHTAIWVFFNLVIFYLFYAGISNTVDERAWICVGFVSLEGLVLVCFRFVCPLTLMARKYSASTSDNFDIYLPNWLAKYTKLIYTTLFVIALSILIYRLLTA